MTCQEPNANFTTVAAGAGPGHSLGLKADGSIVAWGDSYSAQCDVPAPNTGFHSSCRWLLSQPGPEIRRLDLLGGIAVMVGATCLRPTLIRGGGGRHRAQLGPQV